MIAYVDRPSQSLPVSFGTLDAVHLATALEWSESRNAPLVMATHDAQLALAARSLGLATVGT